MTWVANYLTVYPLIDLLFITVDHMMQGCGGVCPGCHLAGLNLDGLPVHAEYTKC